MQGWTTRDVAHVQKNPNHLRQAETKELLLRGATYDFAVLVLSGGMCVPYLQFWSGHVMLMDAVIVERNKWGLAPQQHSQQNMQLVPTVVKRTSSDTLVQYLRCILKLGYSYIAKHYVIRTILHTSSLKHSVGQPCSNTCTVQYYTHRVTQTDVMVHEPKSAQNGINQVGRGL